MSRVQTLIDVVAANAAKGTYPCEIVSYVVNVCSKGTVCNAPERMRAGEQVDSSKGLVVREDAYIRKNCDSCILDEYLIFTEIVDNL